MLLQSKAVHSASESGKNWSWRSPERETAYLSGSDAILINVSFCGVGFASAIIAARVGAIVLLPPDRDHPVWGYESYEALYVMFRSLVLVGVTVFAGFGAAEKILAYSFGEEPPELVLGPIVIYTIAMSVICFGLAAWHRSNWTQSGKQSEVLKIESKASLIDGIHQRGCRCRTNGEGAAKGHSTRVSCADCRFDPGARLVFGHCRPALYPHVQLAARTCRCAASPEITVRIRKTAGASKIRLRL